MVGRELMLVGGPGHGMWVTDDGGPGRTIIFPGPIKLDGWSATAISEPPSLADMQAVTYTRREIMWPGWRFPLQVFVAPGVEVRPQQPDAWPNPLVLPRCRCARWPRPAAPGVRWTGEPTSACHLDHCPVHAEGYRDRPSSLDRMTAAQYRQRWLAEQRRQREEADEWHWQRPPGETHWAWRRGGYVRSPHDDGYEWSATAPRAYERLSDEQVAELKEMLMRTLAGGILHVGGKVGADDHDNAGVEGPDRVHRVRPAGELPQLGRGPDADL